MTAAALGAGVSGAAPASAAPAQTRVAAGQQTAAEAIPTVTHGSGYIAVRPARVLDTRSGVGVAAVGPVGPAGTLTLGVLGRGGIPTQGVGAVVMNVTATNVTRSGFVTVFPSGTARPGTSSLNPVAGQTTANLVVTKVGSSGAVALYNAVGSVHLIADVVGWLPSGSDIASLEPSRLLDTRARVGVPGTSPVGAGGAVRLGVLGRGGVPSSGVGAVILNVTATSVTRSTFVTVYPAGAGRPATSSLNPVVGRATANLVVAKLGEGGAVDLYNAVGSLHLIADVVGWVPVSSDYGALVPARLLDTRSGVGRPGTAPVPGGGTVRLSVLGRGGVPAARVGAAVLNVTATNVSRSTFVTVHPGGSARPDTSSLNPAAGVTTANLVVAGIGADGSVDLYNALGTIHLIVDVVGWLPSASSTVAPSSGADAVAVAGNGVTIRSRATDAVSAGALRVHEASATGVRFSASGLAEGSLVEIDPQQIVGEASATAAGSGTTTAIEGRDTSTTTSVLRLPAIAGEQVVTWQPGEVVALALSDHADFPDPEAAVELAEGLGGSLCSDEDNTRLSIPTYLPLDVCFDRDGGVLKTVNKSANWIAVTAGGGLARPVGGQYDGNAGPRRTIDVAYHQAFSKPLTHLSPGAAINWSVAAPYTGDVGFTTRQLSLDSLAPNIAVRLAAITGRKSVDVLQAAVGIVDVSRRFSDCLGNDERTFNDVRCTSGFLWDVGYEAVRYGIASKFDLKLVYRIGSELVPFLRDLTKQLGESLAYSDASFTLRGTSSTTPVQPPEQRPITQQPAPTQESGELYSGGTRSCAATYIGHPRPAPSTSWSASVDVNADGGDYGRTLFMPWAGNVRQVFFASDSSGWGNAWIIRRSSDGYELFVAHGLETLATGDLAAGTAFGRAGNTGKVIGTTDQGGAHLHINARLNGVPAPVVLGATTVEPGICWVARSGPTAGTSPIVPPPGGSASVALALGATAPSGNWYDVTLAGFPANQRIPVQCHDSVDRAFFTAYLQTDANGNARDTTTCYSNLGGKQVTAGGITVSVGASGSTTTPTNPGTPPATTQSLQLAQGAPAPYGFWYDVTLRGFAPSTTYAVVCHDSADRGFYTAHLSTDGSGFARDATTCYSSLGGKQVTADGLTVNLGETATRSNGTSTPPPAWSIALVRGGSAPSGFWYDVAVRGPAGSAITLYCNDSVDRSFYTQTLTTDGAGNARDTTLCYSADGPDHWVTSNVGVESNHVGW